MDPITTAVLASLPLLATDAVKSAYEGLKAIIRKKWGDNGSIAKAITAIEQDPDSKAQAAVLEEKVVSTKATEDVEVAQALHKLIEQIKAQGAGSEALAKIQFNMS